MKQTTLNEPQLDLEEVQGKVTLTKNITLNPFETLKVSGNTSFRKHSKRMNVIIERPERHEHSIVAPVVTYTVLKPGLTCIQLGLQNLLARSITLKSKTTIAKFSAANAVPDLLAPDPESVVQNGEGKDKLPLLSNEKQKELNDKIDLTGISHWTKEQQAQVQQLFIDFGSLFALDSLDLGKTSAVKHKIRLDNYTPFKERYRCIPPHLYEEVKKHLKEMMDIGAIQKSSSPWASAVVLVRKKDGGLRFCIDLRRLNAHTIKDAYSLPRIDEALDCLGGARIFTSLDLKSGYWQVEMDEDLKELTAFTVGPLGFYECDRMPFGLTNAPATFQCLMESCLGDEIY